MGAPGNKLASLPPCPTCQGPAQPGGFRLILRPTLSWPLLWAAVPGQILEQGQGWEDLDCAEVRPVDEGWFQSKWVTSADTGPN